MVRLLLRIIGAIIACVALVGAFFAYIFRFDSSDELAGVMRLDVELGFLFALAFLLWRVPSPPGATATRHAVTAVGIVLIWASVSGWLVWHHQEQVRMRSTPPVQHLPAP